jgi:hypothetical protein
MATNPLLHKDPFQVSSSSASTAAPAGQGTTSPPVGIPQLFLYRKFTG